VLGSHASVNEAADKRAGNRANNNNEAARTWVTVCLFLVTFIIPKCNEGLRYN